MDVRASYDVERFYPKFLAYLNGISGNHNTLIDSSRAYVTVDSRGDLQSARDRCLIQTVSVASTIYSRICCCKVYVFASEKDGGLCKELVNGRV